MSRDTSMAFVGIDRLSGPLNQMLSKTKALDKGMEEAGREIKAFEEKQKSLVKQQAKAQSSLEALKKELKEAQKAFRATGDEASRQNLEKAYENYNRTKNELGALSDEARRTQKALNELNNVQSKMQNRVSGGNAGLGGQDGNGLLKTLAGAGLWNMAGQSIANAAGTYLNSALGTTAGNEIATVLSSTITGAVMGSVGGPVGAAIGGVVGGVTGIINAASQTFASQDEAYKAAVQDFYTDAQEKQAQSLQNGTAVAAGREKDEIAFSHLLGGEEIAKAYLGEVQQMANFTPFQYEDLTALSKVLAPGFGDDTGRMMELLQMIGDTGSTSGLDAAGMGMVATALSRLESTDKTTLEYLNLMQERGIDAYGALAASLRDEEGNELSVAEMLQLVSRGELSGKDTVRALTEYFTDPANGFVGAMEEQSRTYAGLTSTVEGLWNNIDAAMGAGYTEKRKEGLTAEVDWLGENSAGMEEIYSQIGQYQAELENEKQRLYLEAMEAAAAEVEAQELTGAAAGEALAKAEMEARAKYLASDGYKEFEESQMRIVRTAQESALIGDAWQSLGYRMGLEFEKGMNSVVSWSLQSFADRTHREARREVYGEENFLPGDSYAPGFGAPQAVGIANQAVGFVSEPTAAPNAWGLDRVPYDGYRAILHEGEQVLTAREARENRQQAGSIHVSFDGANFSVREEADIDRIAQAIVEQISRAAMLAGA